MGVMGSCGGWLRLMGACRSCLGACCSNDCGGFAEFVGGRMGPLWMGVKLVGGGGCFVDGVW